MMHLLFPLGHWTLPVVGLGVLLSSLSSESKKASNKQDHDDECHCGLPHCQGHAVVTDDDGKQYVEFTREQYDSLPMDSRAKKV